jgi:hypothetical protein
MEMGLTAGTECSVVRYAPLGDPMQVKIRGYLLSLRASEAEGVQVRPADCLPTTGHVLARLARESGQDGGRALLARHRQVAEFVRAEYFRVVGGDA